eukprot:g44953.t1
MDDDDKIREGYVDILGHVAIKEEVELSVLKNIKVDKSRRPDGIYHRILREELDGPMTKIFVFSLETGEVPEEWRIAHVVPLFKKGNRDYRGSYRPEVTKMIDEGRAVDAVYMDFTKAFEKVDWSGRLGHMGST